MLSQPGLQSRTKQGGRISVEVYGCVRMPPQDGGRGGGADFAFEALLHSLRFAAIGNHGKYLFRLENLADGHGEGPRGHLRYVGKPSFSDLLLPASLIQIHNDIGLFHLEIRRRVIERDVPVFTDSEECNVNRGGGQRPSHHSGNLGGIGGVSLEQVVLGDSGLQHQLLHQHLAEAAGMRDRQTNILVQVKCLHPAPVQTGDFGKRIQKSRLRGRGGGYNAGTSTRVNGAPDGCGRLLRCRATQRNFILEDLQQHGFYFLAYLRWIFEPIIAKLLDTTRQKWIWFSSPENRTFCCRKSPPYGV